MDVSIICVNWNSLEYLRECIASIYEWTQKVSYEIIVVDNASPKGDVDELKQVFPRIILIKSERNLGFGGANNLGANYASGDYLLFLNPDTKLVSDALDVMIGTVRMLPDAGIIGCKLLNGDMSIQTSSILHFPRLFDAFLEVEYLRLRWPKVWGIGPLFQAEAAPAKVEAVSGACMLIKRSAFQDAGMFSADYFMYAEDLDLCRKVARTGLQNYFVGRATIVHYGGKSSSPEWQTVMKTKAEAHFCRTHYSRMHARSFRIASLIGACMRLTLLACARVSIRNGGARRRVDTAWTRWTAIFHTLLTAGSPDAFDS